MKSSLAQLSGPYIEKGAIWIGAASYPISRIRSVRVSRVPLWLRLTGWGHGVIQGFRCRQEFVMPWEKYVLQLDCDLPEKQDHQWFNISSASTGHGQHLLKSQADWIHQVLEGMITDGGWHR